jgi:hypothetical protein
LGRRDKGNTEPARPQDIFGGYRKLGPADQKFGEINDYHKKDQVGKCSCNAVSYPMGDVIEDDASAKNDNGCLEHIVD